MESKALTALDMGGFAALAKLLAVYPVYHLNDENGYWRVEEKSASGCDELTRGNK